MGGLMLLVVAVGTPLAGAAGACRALAPFQGMWEIVEASERGKSVEPHKLAKIPVKVAGNQMSILHEFGMTVKWTVTVRPGKETTEIDVRVVGDRNKVDVLLGICKFSDGTLTIALGSDADAPRPKKFEPLPAPKSMLVVVLKKAE